MELKKLIVVAIFAVALCCSTVACGEQDKPEEHEYAYYQASAPTCTEKGKIERRCVDCGETDYLEAEAPGRISENSSDATASELVFGNDAITHATVYYYSEARPSYSGNYWHYVSGVPTVW